jgi:diketogulonate reductase-like aldo/keto reductase
MDKIQPSTLPPPPLSHLVHSIPYDPNSPLQTQVRQSFHKSLENLQTPYLDSILLHSPMPRYEDTLQVWSIFEEFHNQSQVLSLGISNIYDVDTLRSLYRDVIVKPSFVQNRFYSKTSYDKEIRKFCKQHDIVYQSFWSLTANKNIINRFSLSPALATAPLTCPCAATLVGGLLQ